MKIKGKFYVIFFKEFFCMCDEMFDSIVIYFGNIFIVLVLIFIDFCMVLLIIKVNLFLWR